MSLLQLGRAVAAVRRHADAGLLSIAVLRSPTTGGVFASYASACALRVAEAGAVIGFAGPRVVAETTGEAVAGRVAHAPRRPTPPAWSTPCSPPAEIDAWVEAALGLAAAPLAARLRPLPAACTGGGRLGGMGRGAGGPAPRPAQRHRRRRRPLLVVDRSGRARPDRAQRAGDRRRPAGGGRGLRPPRRRRPAHPGRVPPGPAGRGAGRTAGPAAGEPGRHPRRRSRARERERRPGRRDLRHLRRLRRAWASRPSACAWARAAAAGRWPWPGPTCC